MSAQIQTAHFTKALYALLDETFDNVQGYFLDKTTSMFETLATISAEEALVPVGGKRATLAARVKHVAFYLDVLEAVMYGLIGKMLAVSGQRDALISVLLEGTAEMPGCLSYVVAKDPADANAIWVTEVWDSQQSHQASLSLPAVQYAIARGKPLIASFDHPIVTEPVGGHGLVPTDTQSPI